MAAKSIVDFVKDFEKKQQEFKVKAKERLTKHASKTATLLVEHLLPESLDEAKAAQTPRFTLTFAYSSELLEALTEMLNLRPEPKPVRKSKNSPNLPPSDPTNSPNLETL